MNEEQKKQVIDTLVEFVIRVSNGRVHTENEVKVLPGVVSLLLSYSQEEEKKENILGEKINLRINGEELFKAIQQANEKYMERHTTTSPLSTMKQALTEAMTKAINEEKNTTILPDEIHRIVLDFDKNDFHIDGVKLGKGCTKLDISYGCFDWNIGVCVDEKEENSKYVRRYGLPGISKKI